MSQTPTPALPLPTTKQWLVFLSRLLLLTGLLFLIAAASFFIAANWGGFGRFSKLFSLQLLLCLQVVGFAFFQQRKPKLAKAILATASLLLGVLLAFVGQTYQTGADPWQLFALWALLIIPWACLVNHWGLWLWCVLLVDIAIVLFYQSFGSWLYSLFDDLRLLSWLLLFHGACLMVGQLLIKRFSFAWQTGLRLLGFCFCGLLMLLVVFGIIYDAWWAVLAGFLLATAYSWLYRYQLADTRMLASVCLFYLVAITALLSRFVITHFFAGGFLLLAAAVIFAAIAMVNYLKDLQKVLDNEQ